MQKKPCVTKGSTKGFVSSVISALYQSPKKHSQLKKILGVGDYALNQRMRQMLIPRKSYEVIAGYWFSNNEGMKDRVYTLVKVDERKKYPERKASQSVKVSEFRNKYRDIASRERCKKLAKKRARLIRAGKYNAQEERKLCGET